jgi:hypothetical protein
MPLSSVLDLRVPRNLTALLQHLQRLVGPEDHRFWCGGIVPITKLAAFTRKMEQRYPLLRNTRERTYDRHKGRAVVHMILYPTGTLIRQDSDTRAVRNAGTADLPNATVIGVANRTQVVSGIAWWLVSGPGTGGLDDATMPDTHVAHDAMSKDGHITMGDYVLLYAAKKEPRSIRDPRTGQSRRIFKEVSTWTWKLRSEVFRQVRASIDDCCSNLAYGAEPSASHDGWGILGLLAVQRRRPLFSGVRNQVVDLHRYARDAWAARRQLWLAANTACEKLHGTDAGALRPIDEILAEHLPKMVRVRVYDDPPCRLIDLLEVSK